MGDKTSSLSSSMKSKIKSTKALKSIGCLSPLDGFALAFGLFLGLALLKFGNPVILDAKISAPHSFSEAWSQAWPPHWSFWLLPPLAFVGMCLTIGSRPRWPGSRGLWILPLTWFGWQ